MGCLDVVEVVGDIAARDRVVTPKVMDSVSGGLFVSSCSSMSNWPKDSFQLFPVVILI